VDSVIKTKGVWVYHMLRQEMGDALFFATLRRLIQTHADGWLSLNDFRSAFLAAAPSNPTRTKLARFFAQWLDRNEAPIFDVSWSDAGKERNHQVAVTLRQRGNNGEPFELQLEVAIEAKEGTRVHTIMVNGKETRAVLACRGVPIGVRLDPKQRLFLWRPEYGRRP
jgi:aminopeptidase N